MTDRAYDLPQITALATEALHASIRNAFDQMLGVPIELEPDFIERAAQPSGPTIAGIIGWAGDWYGIGVLSCKPQSACRLAGLMLGTSTSSLNEDSLDAIAEMANIIFGSVKTNMESLMSQLLLGTPSVLYRSCHDVRGAGGGFTVTPARLGDDVFYLKMQFSRKTVEHPPSELPCFQLA